MAFLVAVWFAEWVARNLFTFVYDGTIFNILGQCFLHLF